MRRRDPTTHWAGTVPGCPGFLAATADCRLRRGGPAMNKAFASAVASLFTAMLCADVCPAEERYGAVPASIKDDLDRLVHAYPDAIASHDGAFLVLKDGTRFPISDGRTDKTFRSEERRVGKESRWRGQRHDTKAHSYRTCSKP